MRNPLRISHGSMQDPTTHPHGPVNPRPMRTMNPCVGCLKGVGMSQNQDLNFSLYYTTYIVISSWMSLCNKTKNIFIHITYSHLKTKQHQQLNQVKKKYENKKMRREHQTFSSINCNITYVSVVKLLSGRRFNSFAFLVASISASHFSSFSFKSAASYNTKNNDIMMVSKSINWT